MQWQRFCFLVKNWLNLYLGTLLTHESPEGFKGKKATISFHCFYLRYKGRTSKSRLSFFKLESVSILTIHSQTNKFFKKLNF